MASFPSARSLSPSETPPSSGTVNSILPEPADFAYEPEALFLHRLSGFRGDLEVEVGPAQNNEGVPHLGELVQTATVEALKEGDPGEGGLVIRTRHMVAGHRAFAVERERLKGMYA